MGAFKDDLREIIKALQALLPEDEQAGELSYSELQQSYQQLKSKYDKSLAEQKSMQTTLHALEKELSVCRALVDQPRKENARALQKVGRKPKLSEVEKNQIRTAYAAGSSMNHLAKMYHVSKSLIFNVVHGKE